MTSAARDSVLPAEIGKYQLVAELARGGMGNVYLAALQGPGGFNKLLVVKELKHDLSHDETYVSMFMEEARLAARLVHPNIVQTNEVGSEGNRHFMVMEFLDGRSLHRVGKRLTETGRLSIGSHLRIIGDALLGLHYAHDLRDFDGQSLGIVHRDVSPLNIFVTFDGQAKVLDFGIAKTADSSLQTATGVLKGRVAYMAPEQAWGNTVDRRADVYSTGVLIWEAAAGRRLWPKMSDVEILARVLREGPPSLRSVCPDAPAELDEICKRAMAKDVEDRYPSALALREDLEAHLARRGDALGMREIGPTVAQAFADERRKMSALIEKTLTRMRAGPRSGVMPTFEADIAGGTHSGHRDESLSTSRVRTPASLPASHPGSMAGSDIPSPLATSGAPWSNERVRLGTSKVILLAAGSAFLISALIFAAFRNNSPPTEAIAPIAASGAAAAAAHVGAESPLREEVEAVELVVRVAPPSAQISIDGAAVSTNPFHARYRKDRQVHHIVASADGYDTKLEDVLFAGDVSVDVSLDRRAAPPPPPPRKMAAPPPAAAPAPHFFAKHAAAPPASDAPPATPPPATASALPEVNPSGGRAPLRPIVTASPYGSP